MQGVIDITGCGKPSCTAPWRAVANVQIGGVVIKLAGSFKITDLTIAKSDVAIYPCERIEIADLLCKVTSLFMEVQGLVVVFPANCGEPQAAEGGYFPERILLIPGNGKHGTVCKLGLVYVPLPKCEGPLTKSGVASQFRVAVGN